MNVKPGKLLRITLADLKTIRIKCQNEKCGAVLELALSTICENPDHTSLTKCWRCGNEFCLQTPRSFSIGMGWLCQSIQALQEKEIASSVQIEFSVPIVEDE